MKESRYLSMIRKTMEEDGDLERLRALRVFAEGSESVASTKKVMEQCEVKMGLRVFLKWV